MGAGHLLCAPGILVGVTPWMMYRLVRLVFSRGNAGVRAGGMAVSAVIGAFTNTALVMGMIFLAFRQAYAAMNGVPVDAVLGIILGIVAGNGIPEAIVAAGHHACGGVAPGPGPSPGSRRRRRPPPASLPEPMILTVDIGNTNVVVGGFAGEEPSFVDRLPSSREWDGTAWREALGKLLRERGLTADKIAGSARFRGAGTDGAPSKRPAGGDAPPCADG